jgi:hypothetical protein
MYSTTVALLSLAVAASAQSFGYGGVGRFPCSRTDASGATVVQLDACGDNIADLQAAGCEAQLSDFYGDVDGGGFKNFGLIPSGSTCTEYRTTGNYFCGIAGAP